MGTPSDSPPAAPDETTRIADATGSIEAIEAIGAGPIAGPVRRDGYPVWSGGVAPDPGSDPAPTSGHVQVRFVGRRLSGHDRGSGDPDDADAASRASSLEARRRVLARVEDPGPTWDELTVAGLRQVHSDRVLAASAGLVGEGDGLVTASRGLALSIVTADCVPVILAGRIDPSGPSGRTPDRASAWALAAVHAGWRGIVAGVVPRALEALAARGVPPTAVTAWIGPAIGACCYEVSEDVAVRVASVSGPECVVPRPGATPLAEASGRPHLDLVAAVRHQLTAAGVPSPRVVLRCTRCDAEHLWSYRRDGKTAGRNHAFAWLDPTSDVSGAAPCG